MSRYSGLKPDFALITGEVKDIEFVNGLEELRGLHCVIPKDSQVVTGRSTAVVAVERMSLVESYWNQEITYIFEDGVLMVGLLSKLRGFDSRTVVCFLRRTL